VRQLELASGRRVRLEEAWALPGPVRLERSSLGAALLASPDADQTAASGGEVPAPDNAARARAWRVSARLELPREALDARTRERVERWLRDSAPAHVDVRLGQSSGGETLFRVGDALRVPGVERLGRAPLGTARLASTTTVARLGESRLDARFSIEGTPRPTER